MSKPKYAYRVMPICDVPKRAKISYWHHATSDEERLADACGLAAALTLGLVDTREIEFYDVADYNWIDPSSDRDVALVRIKIA